MHTSLLAHALSSIAIGPTVTFESLHMVPLLRVDNGGSALDPDPVRCDYAVLDDAIASRDVEITEVSEQGSVPELRVVNRGSRPTLIVDGEELVGARQNRIVNLTILVAARSELTIPVSCVEAGRWRARSRVFAAAPRAQYASGRARRMAQVTDSLSVSGLYRSDQADVWSGIAQKAAHLGSVSATGAMESIFVDHAAVLDAYVRALTPMNGQVGALFAIGQRIVGFDLFDSDVTLRKLLPKLVRSTAVDAIDDREGHRPADAVRFRTTCERFLASVRDAPVQSTAALGLGEDVRLTAPGLTGAALIVDQQVVHLTAFAV